MNLEDIKEGTEVKLIIGGALAFGILTALLSSFIFSTPPGRPGPHMIQNLLIAKTFFTSINIFLMSALAINYLHIYNDTPTGMARGLFIFSIALLLYAVTSSPLFHLVFGFRGPPNIGPFTYIPDMFATTAAMIFIYETYR